MDMIYGRKRVVVLFLTIMLIISGCGPVFGKKFIRKKKAKDEAPPQPIFQTRDYDEVRSNEWWYRLHYSYWWTWHKELVEHLGENPKRDALSSKGLLEELGKMKERLKDDKAASLGAHIDALKAVTDYIAGDGLEGSGLERARRKLEKEMRAIRKEFDYPSAERWIKEDI